MSVQHMQSKQMNYVCVITVQREEREGETGDMRERERERETGEREMERERERERWGETGEREGEI